MFVLSLCKFLINLFFSPINDDMLTSSLSCLWLLCCWNQSWLWPPCPPRPTTVMAPWPDHGVPAMAGWRTSNARMNTPRPMRLSSKSLWALNAPVRWWTALSNTSKVAFAPSSFTGEVCYILECTVFPCWPHSHFAASHCKTCMRWTQTITQLQSRTRCWNGQRTVVLNVCTVLLEGGPTLDDLPETLRRVLLPLHFQSPKGWRQPMCVDSGIPSLLRHLDKTEGNSSHRSGVRRSATPLPADRQGAPGTEGNAGWGGKKGEGSNLWSHLRWESRQTEHPNAKQRCTVRSVPKYTQRLGLYLKLPLTLSIGSCYFCYSNFGVVDIVLRAGVGGGGWLYISCEFL